MCARRSLLQECDLWLPHVAGAVDRLPVPGHQGHLRVPAAHAGEQVPLQGGHREEPGGRELDLDEHHPHVSDDTRYETVCPRGLLPCHALCCVCVCCTDDQFSSISFNLLKFWPM